MLKPRSLLAFALVSVLALAPGWARADEGRSPHDDITIRRNSQFTKANGVRSGSGTRRDPYVISGLEVGNVTISDTTRAVRLVNNSIAGTLTLNWVGRNVVVKGNDVGDLRVNENVPRKGAPTSGTFVSNTITQVGQLRHFDGLFAHNTVGWPSTGLGSEEYPGWEAVNFDGFNGATFAHNTIFGYMTARLHGHHHSSGFGDESHMHSGATHHGDMVNHRLRWHEVMIANNRIFTSNYYALAYVDTDHAQNDRTAASETNKALNKSHRHYTRVHVMDNRLVGGGILVDVFNAPDQLHRTLGRGSMHIEGNRVRLAKGRFYPFESRYGIEIREARNLTLEMARNTVLGPEPTELETTLGQFSVNGAGIFLGDLDRANVSIVSTRVTNRTMGIQATQMTDSVHWTIRRLSTEGVERAVSYDESVENKPRR